MAKKKRKPDPCKKCDGKCCRYLALEIDKPTTKGDYDDIRWYVSHRNVSVFIDSRRWYLGVKGRCQHLEKDNRCKIYDRRPRICRRHKVDSCEFYGEGSVHDHEFNTLKDIEEYMAKRRIKG
jgi:Fe-S-cluster containining protein